MTKACMILLKAATALCPYMPTSEEPTYTSSMATTQVQRLIDAANDMTAKDKQIKSFRSAIDSCNKSLNKDEAAAVSAISAKDVAQ